MVPWKFRLLAAIATLAVLGSAFLARPVEQGPGEYGMVVRSLASLALIAGSLSLSSALKATLLRAGCNGAFGASFVAAAALFGVGAVLGLSIVCPVSVLLPLLTFSVIAMPAGILWWRFYALARP